MRRVISLWIAVIAALWTMPMTAASAAPVSPPALANYTYDAPVYDGPANYLESERGPPTDGLAHTTHDAVGNRPHGALARPNGHTTPSITSYDHQMSPAPVARVTTLTGAQVVALDGNLSSIERSGVAANGGIKALPSGPKITAQWGADTYRHGGLMSTIEHINYRHAYNSGFSGVSRFGQGTSARQIKGYVDEVLRTGTVTDRGMVGDLGRTIGVDRAGNPVTGLEIIVRDGKIKTAFPVGIP